MRALLLSGIVLGATALAAEPASAEVVTKKKAKPAVKEDDGIWSRLKAAL